MTDPGARTPETNEIVARVRTVRKYEPVEQPTRYFFASVGAHLVVLAVALLAGKFLASPSIDLDAKPIRATLVRQGKPRDEKLLPAKEEAAARAPTLATKREEPPAPASMSPPTVAPARPTKPSAPSSKSLAPPPKATDSLAQAFATTGRAPPPEGQANGDPQGDAARQEGDRYFALLRRAIARNYDVSDTIPEQERSALSAEVVLWLARDGATLEVKLTKPSGNALFDRAVLAAVSRAAPFPPVPENVSGELQHAGVAFAFRAMK